MTTNYLQMMIDSLNKKKKILTRIFDVDAALCSDGVFYNLLNSGDILWLNILDKMNMYAPDNKRVIELVEWMNENNYE